MRNIIFSVTCTIQTYTVKAYTYTYMCVHIHIHISHTHTCIPLVFQLLFGSNEQAWQD